MDRTGKITMMFAGAAVAVASLATPLMYTGRNNPPEPGLGCDSVTQAIRSVDLQGTAALALYTRQSYSANGGVNALKGPFTLMAMTERDISMTQNNQDAANFCRWINEGGIVTPAHILALNK